MADKIVIDIIAKDQASAEFAKVAMAANTSFNALSGSFAGMAAKFALFGAGLTALAAPLKAAIDQGREFQKSISGLAAAANFTTAELNAMQRAAQQIGTTTAFSAKEAADAMGELSRAGFNSRQILDSINPVLNLAAAQSYGLAGAAEAVAIQMQVFAKQGLAAGEAADIINKTANASAQGIEHLVEAYKNISGVAVAAKISFEDINIALGQLANAGVRGSDAGTVLRIAIQRLIDPPREAQEALQKLKISMSDINPESHSLRDIFERLRLSGANLKDILTIMGSEAGPKLVSQIKDGAAGWDAMKKGMDDAKGAAQGAHEQMNNLDGDIKLFKGSLAGLGQIIFQETEQPLRNMIKALTEAVKAVEAAAKSPEWNRAFRPPKAQLMGDQPSTQTPLPEVKNFNLIEWITNIVTAKSETRKFVEQLQEHEKQITKTAEATVPLIKETAKIAPVLTDAQKASAAWYSSLKGQLNNALWELGNNADRADEMLQGMQQDALDKLHIPEIPTETTTSWKTFTDEIARLADELTALDNAPWNEDKFKNPGQLASEGGQSIIEENPLVKGAIKGAAATGGNPMGALIGALLEVAGEVNAVRALMSMGVSQTIELLNAALDPLVPLIQEFGDILLILKPIFELIGNILGQVVAAIDKFVGGIEKSFAPTSKHMENVFNSFETDWERETQSFMHNIEEFGEDFLNIEKWQEAGSVALANFMAAIGDGLGGLATSIIDGINTFFSGEKWQEAFQSFIANARNLLGDIFTAIGEKFFKPIAVAVQQIGSLFGPIVKTLQTLAGTITGFKFPDLPHFEWPEIKFEWPDLPKPSWWKWASGGMIPKAEDGLLVGASHAMGGIPLLTPIGPIEAEGGEFILRKSVVDRLGAANVAALNDGRASLGGGINLSFNVSAINPKGQANEIRQLIEEMIYSGRLRTA